MDALEIITQLIVIVGFILYAYTKIKGQTMRDTFDEIRALIEVFKNG